MQERPVILLVDDAEEDALIIQRAFREVFVPHRLVTVPSGEAAIHYLLGADKYDDRTAFPFPSLVLLDLKMPGTDGFDVLKWVRAMPAFGGLRIIVLTNSPHMADVNRAYSLGANSFLVKPSDFDNTQRLAKALVQHWLVDSRTPEAPVLPSQILPDLTRPKGKGPRSRGRGRGGATA